MTASALVLRSILLVFAVLYGAVAGGSAAMAQIEKSKVVLGYGSMSGAFASFWIAEDKGYFKEQGLDAEVTYTSTTTGLQAMIAGQIDALGTGCSEFFEATARGFENKVVANLFEFNLYLIASSKEITDAKMLVGKAVAVNRIGDTSHLSVRFALRQLGIDPDKVSYVQVGSTPERFAALKSGAVAAVVQAGSLKPLVIKEGFNVLIDLQRPDIPSCLGGIGVSAKTAKEQPKTVEAILKGILKGNAYLSDGPDADTQRIFGKYMKLPPDDSRVLEAWQYFKGEAHYKKPAITDGAVKNVLAMMAEADAKWAKEDPKRFVDQSFMQKLDKDGYLDAVYSEIKK
jgi:NitT/TauT family transport system substrate-binding protein